MKRNILLLFGLIGLVMLDWSCTKTNIDGGGGSKFHVIGIGKAVMYEIIGNDPAFVPVNELPYYQAELWVGLETERITKNANSNYSALAMPAPECDYRPDSMRIFRNNTEITHLFFMDNLEVNEAIGALNNNEFFTGFCEIVLKPKDALANNQFSKYTFKLFNKDGSIFETTSDYLKITL